jgi:DNA replication and repair protein RecF
MFVHRLHLSHFRTYARMDLDLQPGPNLLFGENGAGKTNLLEGIVFAATGRSPRASSDQELIQWEETVGLARVDITTQRRGDLSLEVALTAGASRRIKINGVVRPRAGDLVGLAPTVQFWPDDLDVIKGEPSGRRRFLNSEIGSLSRSYDWHLTRYQRVVEQRNRLLREHRGRALPAAALAGWDEQLLEHGSHLVYQRSIYLRRLSAETRAVYPRIAGKEQELNIRYLPALGDEEGEAVAAENETSQARFGELLAQGLERRRDEERQRGLTLIGPHRDDVEFLLEGRSLRAFGSQGEQRSAMIAVRVALFGLVRGKMDEPPLLVLDDVFSELDPRRREGLLRSLAGAEQFIITGTDPEALPSELLADARVFVVSGGQVTPR